MATGTGKTRTAMGLVDIFLRTSWAQKILFVADRDALVEQTLNDGFKAHLPHEPRIRVHTATIDTDKRLYVATLQTMARCFERFSPGFFDLVIFDEAHRSILNRFNELIEYFDARMIGLTATPAAFIDRDTLRRQWEEIMDVCLKDRGGHLPGKTIVFAIPEVVNLVFMKPVQSRIKLWQMIGRGTRNQEACRYFDRLPDGRKTKFLIIDFWQNDFGKQTEGRVPPEMPVLVRLFNTRLDILTATLKNRGGVAHQLAAADCRAMLARVPVESFLVRKVWGEVVPAWEDADFWKHITADKIALLRLKVAPLLRLVPDVDVAAETFANKVEHLNLQILRGQPSPDLHQSIAEDVSLLPAHVLAEATYAASAKLATSGDLAQARLPQLEKLIEDLAGRMKNKRRLNTFLKIDLPDFIAGKGYVLIGPSGLPIHVEEYRKRVEARILALTETHPALIAIREGREPSPDALVDLERALHNELTGADIQTEGRVQ